MQLQHEKTSLGLYGVDASSLSEIHVEQTHVHAGRMNGKNAEEIIFEEWTINFVCVINFCYTFSIKELILRTLNRMLK